ncbi:MAG: hypothetical protein IH991_23225 [Planctomycetes bacterium]|nr:hypothetical protein [Planctomycetota bacterium]
MSHLSSTKRRRFQFGVRTLLILLLALSVPATWFGYEVKLKRKEERAIHAIQVVGGHIFPLAPELRIVGFSSPNVEDRVLVQIKYLRDRVLLDLCFGAKGSQLRCLHDAHNLWSLHVPKDTKDADLASIEQLTGLQSLNLLGTAITDAGLQHLSRLRGLQHLDLLYTRCTENAVADLQQTLPNCEIRFYEFDRR